MGHSIIIQQMSVTQLILWDFHCFQICYYLQKSKQKIKFGPPVSKAIGV